VIGARRDGQYGMSASSDSPSPTTAPAASPDQRAAPPAAEAAPPLPLPDIRPPAFPPGATVAVAMSGGVDSSVAAALCAASGNPVVGIMLRLWAEPGARAENKCCHPGAILDAQAAASILGIPFNVLDATDVFYETVVEPFLAAAAAGDTPNPCFSCNRQMRFGYLLGQARALGADFLATGHYARVGRDAEGRHTLLRGLDPAKDQSYMLHRLGQEELRHAAFPVGGYTKPQVRLLAAHWGLPAATRADSMDLCWTGADGVAGFLTRRLPTGLVREGAIVDRAGRELGRHHGLPTYTLGQRRGIGVAGGAPLYVTDLDREQNRLVLGPEEDLLTVGLRLDRLHWVSGAPPEPDAPLEAMVRYRSTAVPARLRPLDDGTALLRFATPQRAPTPGQGLVLYQGERVLGGGRIDRRLTAAELDDAGLDAMAPDAAGPDATGPDADTTATATATIRPPTETAP